MKKISVPSTGPTDRRRTTEQQGGVAEERQRSAHRVRLHGGGQDVHDAAEGTEQTADDQRLHLDGEDVLAEAAHRVLVLADAAQRAPHGLRTSR